MDEFTNTHVSHAFSSVPFQDTLSLLTFSKLLNESLPLMLSQAGTVTKNSNYLGFCITSLHFKILLLSTYVLTICQISKRNASVLCARFPETADISVSPVSAVSYHVTTCTKHAYPAPQSNNCC